MSLPLISRWGVLVAAALIVFPASPVHGQPSAATPGVGDEAPAFSLSTPDGQQLSLRKLKQRGPVVLIVLRGYPGYQCPICSRQVGEFIRASEKLKEAGASVAMIYPGPASRLENRAREFLRDVKLPARFHLLIDPGYEFTRAYRLRWDAPRETAYPATFVIAEDGRVTYARVSRSHGGRASVDEVLSALGQPKRDG